jgi:hypothetical protein
MSVTNIAIYFDMAMDGYSCVEVQATGSTQAGATRVGHEFVRNTGGASNSGLVLPHIGSCEVTAGKYVVMNDGPNNIKVYCAASESHNGSGNASLTVPAGQTGVFFPVPNGKGGTQDWRSAVVS